MTVERKFWMPYRKGFALRGMTVLFLLACFPSISQAEQCTPTPKCEDLGYTETSCPGGGGVKCPWNTSLMYCAKKCVTCEDKTCQVGDVLYSDKKCYACLANTLPNQVPIGVVFNSGKAVALSDLSGTMTWSNAFSACSNYRVAGVSGWYLPSKDELLQIYRNINDIQISLQRVAEGSKLMDELYWSDSVHEGSHFDIDYWVVNPISGYNNYIFAYNMYNGTHSTNSSYIRPVLAF